ncbi:MAG: hypothetical protein LBL91_04405 [Lachnospiraceae bacterium]|jgi:hypothetical protein|nr:hypothetical protein [Lachnospiraceae bacterium]
MKEINSVQNWLPFESILENGIIKLKNKTYVKIIKVNPINFNLKSNLEKEAILNSYKIFLKTCNFDIQILVQSNKENLSKHISNVLKSNKEQENAKIIKISEKYINYIQEINLERKSSSKNFYILIKKSPENSPKKINFYKKDNLYLNQIEEEKNSLAINLLNDNYFKIKECLSRCGNLVEEISSKEEAIQIIFSFLNVRKFLNS